MATTNFVSGTVIESTWLNDVDEAVYTTLAPKASPTFTGTVTLPTPFTLGGVSVTPTGTELNFVDGVTSSIQTQLDAKAPLASPTFTGTLTAAIGAFSGAVSFASTATFVGAFGYTTGAGGTVTQATSRTTGVTLNKPTGAITLFSAAGSATAATFTVTNSEVAATDTIILNQVSGTDLYELNVTAVAAGSFNITFKTTGGTTTEQPVFRFTVIKGVSA